VNGKKGTVVIDGCYPPPWGGVAYVVKGLLGSCINDDYNVLHYRTGHTKVEQCTRSQNIRRETKLILKLGPYLLKNRNIDIVHIHSSSYDGFWRYSLHVLIAKMLRKKVLFHLHGAEFDSFYASRSGSKKWYIRKIYGMADGIIALSDEWKTFLSTLTDPNKIFVVQNAVDVDSYIVADDVRTEFREEHGIPENAVVFLYLGHFIKRKGVPEILEAFDAISRELVKEAPDGAEKAEPRKIFLLFIGSMGDLTEEVRAYCEARPEMTKYLGTVSSEDKIRALGGSDALLLPTFAEGLPIVILEAMAARLALITTRVGGIPSTVAENVNCLYVEPGDAADLKEKVMKMADDKQFRDELKTNNVRLVHEKFSWDVAGTKVIRAYDTILGREDEK
jgi:glycosyltransferase involved in cell wall biosynthesis